MVFPPGRRCTKCKGLKRRECGFLQPRLLMVASRPFTIPSLFASFCHPSLHPALNATLSHAEPLEAPYTCLFQLKIAVPIPWHSVDGIFGGYLDISSQSPSGCDWALSQNYKHQTRCTELGPAHVKVLHRHLLWGNIILETKLFYRQRKRDTERLKQTQREPIIFPFLRKTVLRLDSERFPKFLIINPLQLACQQKWFQAQT